MVKALVSTLICILYSTASLAQTELNLGQPLALVYKGPGSCEDGDCSKAAAHIAERAGLRVRYVGPHEITPDILGKASLWIQPGGDALEAAAVIPAQSKQHLRDFIRSGGRYLGFCAGAFFADTWIDNANTIPGLGIMPGQTQDYTLDKQSMVLPVMWGYKIRFLYFQDGARFEVPSNLATPIAFYENGQTAAIQTTYGSGRVALSGPHPEAPKEWHESENLRDPDGTDYDLADGMLRWLMSPKPAHSSSGSLQGN